MSSSSSGRSMMTSDREKQLTIDGAPRLLIVPIIDLRLSAFSPLSFTAVLDVAVFDIGGTFAEVVEVRYLLKDVGGGLAALEPDPPVRIIDARFILGACLIRPRGVLCRWGHTILGALRLAGRAILCLLFTFSSSALTLAAAFASSGVSLTIELAVGAVSPDRS